MSDSPAALREDDAMKMLVCETHLGSIKVDFQAEQYVWKRRVNDEFPFAMMKAKFLFKNFKEPRLLIVSDPLVDHQAITEASYVNIPVISFCNTDSPLKYIDIGIPCNNKYIAASAGEAVKLDFQVPHIDDWAAASTWEQPGEVAAVPPPTQPAAPTTTAEPAQEWGAGAGSW
ncbi:ribosomal protein s2 domain-containing protein [Ditylenchus destructor]|uniref:40S ribosomal protein SA n=1 Tax=Ditylenchus destructor TaxID=166010 RepID=A0AAD4R265_9BILA|nr:ribosomal protein s2 domain-containing protein [Ditylenchus destructor]